MYEVNSLTTTAALDALADDWNRLARGVPFRSFDWLKTWWTHYGGERELFVLAVQNADDELIGLAPWMIDVSPVSGRVLMWLGTGEVCSDYLSVLCVAGQEDSVASALAEHLTGEASRSWDLIHLEGVDAEDLVVVRLLDEMTDRESNIGRREVHRCWRAHLPESWDEFLAMQSKSHRKQLRRFERRTLDSDRSQLFVAHDQESWQRGWDVLVDLHQRRRESLDEPGCFASPQFKVFHREVSQRLLTEDRLRLYWLECDGTPIAAEYQLAGDGIIYAYQSGVDPDRLDEEPGRLIMIATIGRAIAEGRHGFDFLRGDEPYKAHWRAEPRQAFDYRIVSRRASARLRHNVWRAADGMKNALKDVLPTTR